MNTEPRSPTGYPLVIITGLSGAGKSTAMRVFEDLGCYCLDNLPPALIGDFYTLYRRGNMRAAGVVIASDVRSGDLFDDFQAAVAALQEAGIDCAVVYLDSADDVLINRFSEVRRSHPLQPEFSLRLAIQEERRRLRPIRAVATHVIDTSHLDTAGLRQSIIRTVTERESSNIISLKFVSFGFKYGPPRDADFVFDVRFLPNPFYVADLQGQTGEDAPVFDYVMTRPGAESFFDRIVDLLDITLNGFVEVGKFALTVGVGCTGGRHRSVAFARKLAEHYASTGRKSGVSHRDLSRPQ